MVSERRHYPRIRGESSRQQIIGELARRREAGERNPTLRELADTVDMSTRTLRFHLTILEDQQIIRREPGARGIRLIGGAT